MNKDNHLLAEAYRVIAEQPELSPNSRLRRFIPQPTPSTEEPKFGSFIAAHKPHPPTGYFNQVVVTPRGGLDLNEEILFDFDKATLKPTGLKILGQIAQKISSLNNPDIQVNVVGYTDLYGGTSYNQQLSMARAEAVSNILQKAGINRVSAKPGGMKNPKVPLKFDLIGGKAPAEGIAQQQPNRRVEIEFNPPLPRQIVNSFSTLK